MARETVAQNIHCCIRNTGEDRKRCSAIRPSDPIQPQLHEADGAVKQVPRQLGDYEPMPFEFIKNNWDKVGSALLGAGAFFGLHQGSHKRIEERLKALEASELACKAAVDSKLDCIDAKLNLIVGYIKGQKGQDL